ncbi:hypothetical protein [Pleurocapsa sp. FMAR1]|nr:hypothetical protein [Pleurocapsa sp. FMAR1]
MTYEQIKHLEEKEFKPLCGIILETSQSDRTKQTLAKLKFKIEVKK